MKNEKGITIISLIVYVIILTFVIAGVTSITAHFYGNMNEMDRTSKSAVAFAKFNMIFLNDIKSEGAKIEGTSSGSGVQLNLSHIGNDGMQETISYIIQGNSLYRKQGNKKNIKICNGIKEGKITANTSNGTVTVYLKINNYEKTTTYAIEPKIKVS